MQKGQTKSFRYILENQGSEPLRLEFVDACECTTVEWPDDPIFPGEKASIQAVFDSTNEENIKEGDINLVFENIDPKTGNPLLVTLEYRAVINE